MKANFTDISAAFYNVENLFDTKDAPNKEDESFLPNGEYNWTEENYKIKISNLAKAISQLGDADGPELLGLSEVENKTVLQDLINDAKLKGRNYEFIHEESKDLRGIDNAFIYDPEVFSYTSHQKHAPVFPEEPGYTSRDILQVSGQFSNGENLHIFINHWPSRREGAKETEGRRVAAANTLRAAVDKLFTSDPDANIIIMGDFNDNPMDKSVKQGLKSFANVGKVKDQTFFNPMAAVHDPNGKGTLMYKGKWDLFDQIILSENMVLGEGNCRYKKGSANVYNPQFLRVGFGRAAEAPRRAIFRGEFVPEGYSDHFPVYVQLQVN